MKHPVSLRSPPQRAQAERVEQVTELEKELDTKGEAIRVLKYKICEAKGTYGLKKNNPNVKVVRTLGPYNFYFYVKKKS